MEELEGIHGAEGGSDLEFHEIPTQGSSHTSQATYIRAPSQGLSTTNTTNQIVESPNKFNTGNTPTLTILFKMFREDGRPLPVGSFTERSVARRVYNSTGVAVERVTMITPTDPLIEIHTWNVGSCHSPSAASDKRVGRYSGVGDMSDGQ